MKRPILEDVFMILLLAGLVVFFTGCEVVPENSTDTSRVVAPLDPSEQYLVGYWDADQSNNGCATDPRVTYMGYNITGGTFIFTSTTLTILNFANPITFTFDGFNLVGDHGNTYSWVKNSDTTATVTYFPGCTFTFTKRP